MGVEVSFPDELLIALKEDRETFQRQILIYTLGKLYELGRISGGLGAQIMGCTRWEFYRMLSENGFAVIDYGEEEWEDEARGVEQLAKRLRAR
jgi:predicted HTH domain antitoxin